MAKKESTWTDNFVDNMKKTQGGAKGLLKEPEVKKPVPEPKKGK